MSQTTPRAVLSSTNLLFDVDGGANVQVVASNAKLTLTTDTKIEGLANPTADSGAATKAYVDSTSEGLDVKDSCAVATTANIGDLSSVTSQIDSHDLADGDRVLVKDQSTLSENGIYVFTSSNDTLTRADDMANNSHVAGSFTFVEKGDTNADKGFVCTNNKDFDKVGTHDLVFTQFSGAGSITAAQGGGLEMNGTAISIKNDGVTNAMIADNAVNSDQIADDAVGSSQLASESAQSVTIADGDRFILNDNGTMKQVNVTALKTYTTTSGAAAVFGAITATSLELENAETITNSTDGTVLINGVVAAGTGNGAGVFQSNGNNDLTLQTGNSTTGSITITDGANGNIAIVPNGTGEVVVGASNGDQSLDIASHNLSDRGLKLGGTLVTSSATELNLLDGGSAGTIVNSKAVVYGSSGEVNATTLKIAGTAITSSAAELNLLDGGTQPSSVAIQDGDGIILNDNGVMKQVPVTDLKTYTSTSSGVSKTATADGDDLIVSLTAGQYDASLVMSSSGAANDAVQLTASAGGMDITAATALDITTSANSANITIDPHGSGTLALGSADNTAVTLDALALTLTSVNALTLTDGNASLVLGGTGATSLSGATTVDLDCTGALSLNSSAGVINIGNDAVAQAINIGTGAAARTITVGNTAGATAIDVNLGTGGLTVNGSGEVIANTTVKADAYSISDRETSPSYLRFAALHPEDTVEEVPRQLILGETDENPSDDTMVILRSHGSEMGVDMIGEAHHFINKNTGISDAITVGIETDVGTISNGDDIAMLHFSATGSNIDLTNTHVGEIVAKALTNFSNAGVGSDTNRSALVFKVANNGEAEERLRITSDGISLANDSAAIFFGADGEITMTHVHNSGLTLKHKATGDDNPMVLTLATGETDIVATNVIGSLNFQAPDESDTGDARLVCAGIDAVCESDFGGTSNATKLSFKTGASETAAEKVTIDSVGNLSLTASNTELRFYEGSNYVGFEAPALSGDQIWVLPAADGGPNQVLQTNGSGTLSWVTAPGSNSNITIPDSGTIGSSSDPDAISISSTGVVSMSATTGNTNSTNGALKVAGGVGIAENLTVGGDIGVVNITASGTVTSNSDMRLKKDIVEIENCVDKVKKLRGVNFKWIQDDRDDFGVIAQEVEEVAPHAVIENKEGMKSVDYGRLTTLLIQAVKEQQTQIEELKDLVAKLTSKE